MTRSTYVAAMGFVLLSGLSYGDSQETGQDSESRDPIVEPRILNVVKREKAWATFAFSGNGKRFALNDGSTARVWDVGSWKEVASLTDESETRYNYVLLSPDGKILGLTCNGRMEIKLIDAASGKLLRKLVGHQKAIVCPTFSPDGKTIAATDYNDDLKLWDVETGKDLERFKTKPIDSGKARSLAFSPDGRTLAVHTPDGVIHLLDVKKGEPVRDLSPTHQPDNGPRGLAFSPNGRYLAVGARSESTVTIWDLKAAKIHCQIQWAVPSDRDMLTRKLGAPRPRMAARPGSESLAFTGDDRSLVAECGDGMIRVWETTTWGLRYKIEDAFANLAVAPAGTLFAISGQKEKSTRVAICDSRSVASPHSKSAPLDPVKAWSDLTSNDSAQAYESIRNLVSDPKITIPALDKRLATVDSVKPAVIEGHIRDLDDNKFEVRRHAKQCLADLGEIARPALAKAIVNNPSVEASAQIKVLLEVFDNPPQGDTLRLLRAVEVLEGIGSPEARRVLKRIADGDPGALLTREAKAALNRLDGG
jgi:Anaphase-promoting complex subunit 4 WD40 domain/WD domain, G-beta repeat